MTVVAGMLTAGALGYGLLSLASAYSLIGLYVPAAAIAFAAGWGWNGLMIFSVIRTYPPPSPSHRRDTSRSTPRSDDRTIRLRTTRRTRLIHTGMGHHSRNSHIRRRHHQTWPAPPADQLGVTPESAASP